MSDPVAALPLGSRVVVRSRLDPESAGARSGFSLTDVVGILAARDGATVVVETGAGEVTIERSRVVAAKVVPPRPARRGAPHRAIAVDDLQRVMVDGWPPLERAPLGDWVLRAAGGFSNRANSAMTAGSPGTELADAVDAVEGWYAARGLVPSVSVAGPVGFDPAADPLGGELLRRGYRAHSLTQIMTAATASAGAASAADGDGGPVAVSAHLEPAWLAAYERQRSLVPGVTERVLAGSPEQLFASVAQDGVIVAVARLALAHAWAGLSCVWVDPGHRRRGLARGLTTALAAQARARAIRSMYLQVEADNVAADRLYRTLGFTPHHDYAYLTAQQPGR
jgi:GNAT superfamily N-acetyltransferase